MQLTVEVPGKKNRLWHWPHLAERIAIPDDFYAELDSTGNGESDRWYVYVGHIPIACVCRALLTSSAIREMGNEASVSDNDLYEWPLDVQFT